MTEHNSLGQILLLAGFDYILNSLSLVALVWLAVLATTGLGRNAFRVGATAETEFTAEAAIVYAPAMRQALFVLFAFGCVSAPDYSRTHFKCDAERGCPDGQTCIDGLCGNATPSDATSTQIRVQCGATTCTAEQKCCASFGGSEACIALGASCAGLAATCDGIGDCSGTPCCFNNNAIACASSCQIRVCSDNADCGATAPICCASKTRSFPWSQCLLTCL